MKSESKKITEDLKQKVRSLVKQVCVKEHADPNKHMIKEMPGRLNLACPYCGDSHGETHKKRGNLYWATLQFHCFNCGQHSDLYGFLKDHHLKFQDTQDSITIIEYIKDHKVSVNEVETLQHGVFKTLYDLSPTRKELKEAFKLVEIEPGDPAFFYLKNRFLHKKLRHFLYSPRDKRILVLNLAPEDKIIGFQSRSLRKDKNTRYLTYDIEKIYQEMNKELPLQEEQMISCKKLSTLFGIMTANFQMPCTVFEGPLDALFMPNSIALASVTRSTEELDEIPTIRYMFDNDEAGKSKMMQKLKRGKEVFTWDKFLSESKMDKYPSNIKDLNDLVIAAWKTKNKCLSTMDKYFSNSRLDAYYI